MLINSKKIYQLKVSTSNVENFSLINKVLSSFSSSLKNCTVNLPSKKKRFTVIRSPHVNKKSKEHFQIVKHRRLYIGHFSKKELENFLQKIPNDVEITIKN